MEPAAEMVITRRACTPSRTAGDGSLDLDDEGIEQLAFALPALYEQANARSLLYGSDRPYALAARGMRDLLLQAGADASTLSALPV